MNDAQLRETEAANIHKELGKRADVALNVYLTHVILILMMMIMMMMMMMMMIMMMILMTMMMILKIG